jgi:hypothetical protein
MSQQFGVLIMLFFVLISTVSALKQKTIDPTGTYELVAETTKKGGEIYGYSGQIQVKLLIENRIAMNFFVCIGAPSYNSGGFTDTLDYKNNLAIYRVPDIDESCVITFIFADEKVTVDELTDNYNFGCGFGHAVVANGNYKKTSSEVPVLKDPFTGEKIKN